jgi:hypothetical protein
MQLFAFDYTHSDIENTKTNKLFDAENIHFNSYEEGTLFQKILIGRIYIAQKKFKIFRVRNTNELIIENLKIVKNDDGDNFKAKAAEDDTDLVDLLSSIGGGSVDFSGGQFGLIVAVEVDSFEFTRVKQDRSVTLSAKSARAKPGKDRLELYNLVVRQNDTGRAIYAKKGVFDMSNDRVKIAGNYRVSSPKGEASGKGLAVDLYFNLEAL